MHARDSPMELSNLLSTNEKGGKGYRDMRKENTLPTSGSSAHHECPAIFCIRR